MNNISIKHKLSSAVLFAGCLLAGGPGVLAQPAQPVSDSNLQLTVPAPTGPYQVGTVALHLVDRNRQDPYWSTPHARELMVSIWYPTRRGFTPPAQRAPWMEPAALVHYRANLEIQLSKGPVIGPGGPPPPGTPPPSEMPAEPVSLEGVNFPKTHARERGLVERATQPFPVVLYTSGGGEARVLGTSLVEDLASHGYVVVTIDHTYDALQVEFPGGRVEVARPALDPKSSHLDLKLRIADTQFVLDKLAELNAGLNPDFEQRPLPGGLRGCMALNRVGMFGHSFGGATTAQSMAHDPRIDAGIDLDGHVVPTVPIGPPATPQEVAALVGEVATRIGNRPFMIMSSSGKGPDQLGLLMTSFWSRLVGYRRFLSWTGTIHGSYTDEEMLFLQMAEKGILPWAARWDIITPGQAVAAQRAYIRAFFDLWLRNRDNHLLDGPSTTPPGCHPFPTATFFN